MSKSLPGILILGYTGAGKTSLLQGLFGTHLVPEDRVAHGEPGTQSFVTYQNNYLRIYDSMGLEPGEEVEKQFADRVESFMSSLREKAPIERHIHILWYCIDGTRARVTDCDLALIRKLWRHVLVVITKADLTRTEQAQSMIDVLREKGIHDEDILQTSAFDSSTLESLIRRTQDILPAAERSAFRACIKENCIGIHTDHDSRVWSVAFSPDNSLLASGGKDNQVVLRRFNGNESMKRVHKLPATDDVNVVRFSPDGSMLAYGDDDGWVHILAAPFEDSSRHACQQLPNYCYSLAFHPTRPLLAAGSKANAVFLFRYVLHSDGRLELRSEQKYATENDVNCVVYSHDGKFLFFVDDDGILRRALIKKRAQIETWSLSKKYLRSVDAHPNLDLIVVAGDDGRIRICSFEGGIREITARDRKTRVRSVRFSPCGELIVFGDDNGFYGIWDWGRDKLLGEFLCASKGTAVLSVDVSSDGRRIATGLDNGHVKVWSLDK